MKKLLMKIIWNRKFNIEVKDTEEPMIILHADKSVDIEHVVKVMDIAYRNKYKIVLVTKPNNETF